MKSNKIKLKIQIKMEMKEGSQSVSFFFLFFNPPGRKEKNPVAMPFGTRYGASRAPRSWL